MMNEIYLAKTEYIDSQTVRLGELSVENCEVSIDTYRVKWISGTTGYDEVHHTIIWVVDPDGGRWFKKVLHRSYLNPNPNPNPPKQEEFKKLF
jgi:hypothetical protein